MLGFVSNLGRIGSGAGNGDREAAFAPPNEDRRPNLGLGLGRCESVLHDDVLHEVKELATVNPAVAVAIEERCAQVRRRCVGGVSS